MSDEEKRIEFPAAVRVDVSDVARRELEKHRVDNRTPEEHEKILRDELARIREELTKIFAEKFWQASPGGRYMLNKHLPEKEKREIAERVRHLQAVGVEIEEALGDG